MDIDIVQLLTEGGALGLLGLVLYMFNKHFTRLLDVHDKDRSTWLEAIKEITKKLGLIEKDVSEIEDDLGDIKKDIHIIKENI
jgi:septal ring factor EnvC (AmiA/AmiB activator)